MAAPVDRSMQIPDHLAQALKEGRVVASIGAGFSRLAGLPGWETLLRNIVSSHNLSVQFPADFASTPYSDLDALQSDIFAKAGREATFASLQRDLSYKGDQPDMQQRLDAFFKLRLAGVVTWNWDDVLEPRCMPLPPQHDAGGYGEAFFAPPSTPKPPLLQLQGSIHQLGSLVLDEPDYTRVRPARSAFLRRLYFGGERTVLHIGQGLGGLTGGEVGPVLNARADLTPGAPSGPVQHYAVADDGVSAELVEAMERLGVKVIFYPTHGGHDAGIRDLIQKLVAHST